MLSDHSASHHYRVQLDLTGVVVTGDDLLAPRTLSTQIVESGGDYFWWINKNQPALLADLELYQSDGKIRHTYQTKLNGLAFIVRPYGRPDGRPYVLRRV